MRRLGIAAVLVACGLGGCSEFNLVPPCSELGEGVAIALIPNSLVSAAGHIDRQRVRSLAILTDLFEVAHGYNQRTCRGTLVFKPTSRRIKITFRVEQAEGAQNWQKVAFLDAGQPDFDDVVSLITNAYAQGRP
jgi:hypothetical protein